MIRIHVEVLDLHLENRPGGVSSLLDVQEGLADELKLVKSYELSQTQELETKERNQEVLKHETQEALDSINTTDPVIKLRSRLELGKTYVENVDKSSYKLAIPILNEVVHAGTRSTSKDPKF
ncbi:hypothetical protein PG996_007258 [Apiospora saccharicola]|uniref:Uncharacterized protein n=1 Tax=Apiospora saccharicola TaxID=335842 RepID=A0ABR1VAB8_9PEZI